jgi:putative SOS response-associated peptidase YedK
VHITLSANPLLRDIHNTGKNTHRMPAILQKEYHEAWLGGTADEARAALQQYRADLMYAYAVSSKVNSPKNNSPDLLEPVKGATEMQ